MENTIELKAKAYDIISQLEQIEKYKQGLMLQLKEVNDEIEKLNIPLTKEE